MSNKQRLFMMAIIMATMISCEKEVFDDFIKVPLGENFNIELTANMSTGYHWSWSNRDSVTIVDTVGFEYVSDDPGLDGSPGTEIWTFKALKKGEEILDFNYLPPASSGGPGEKSKSFKIRVK